MENWKTETKKQEKLLQHKSSEFSKTFGKLLENTGKQGKLNSHLSFPKIRQFSNTFHQYSICFPMYLENYLSIVLLMFTTIYL